MGFLNPYDDYTPSEGSLWENAVEFLLDLGVGVWLFLLSPVGLAVGILAWISWGGPFLLTCVLLGGGTFALGTLLALISFLRFVLFERKRDQPSASTTRMFVVAGCSILVSSLVGLVAIGYCLYRLT